MLETGENYGHSFKWYILPVLVIEAYDVGLEILVDWNRPSRH